MKILSPSMLAADFGNLERDTLMVEQSVAEWIHIDVMDGSFVPNISYGFPVIKAIKRHSTKVLDVHLMIVHPERFVDRFVKEGAEVLTYHVEVGDNHEEIIALIREAGRKYGVDVKVGLSVKPNTPLSTLEPWLSSIDLVLVMSVEPGFGGQPFIEGSVERVAQLREMIERGGHDVIIEVDGGVGPNNAGVLFGAGADVLVAGSTIFGAADPQAEMVKILNS